MEERRKSLMNEAERDLLIRIDQNLENHINNMENHIKDDRSNFKSVNERIGWLQKIVFMGLGALALLKLFIK